jgi:molybdate-binding protein
VEQTPLGLIPHDGIATTSGQNAAPHSAPPTLVLACCDPAVGLLASEFMRESGIRLLILERSSGKALHLLKQGLVHVAGVHLASVADQGGNKRHVRRLIGPGYELLRAASWDEGIAVSEGLRSFSIDRATRPGIRWVGRDPGSGARRCLEQLFGDRPLPRRVAHDHRGVSALIRGGWADAGVCLRFVSQEAGLPFHPLRTEPYELCFPESASDDPRIQRLIEVVRSPAYRRLIAELPGYDTKDTGNIEHVTAKS